MRPPPGALPKSGRFLGIVHTFTRRAVLNPEEKTVVAALNHLRFPVTKISLEKCFRVEFESHLESPEKSLGHVASKAFINPVVEEFQIEEIRPIGI